MMMTYLMSELMTGSSCPRPGPRPPPASSTTTSSGRLTAPSWHTPDRTHVATISDFWLEAMFACFQDSWTQVHERQGTLWHHQDPDCVQPAADPAQPLDLAEDGQLLAVREVQLALSACGLLR